MSISVEHFKQLVLSYKRLKNIYPDTCIAHCTNSTTLREAIERAALSINSNGKKHPHQYRLKNNILRSFADALLAEQNRISQISAFDELYENILSIRPKGIGELCVYDTAVRIGSFLKISPDKLYLHAGTLTGLNKLSTHQRKKSLESRELPALLKEADLSFYEMEDFLCIFKNEF